MVLAELRTHKKLPVFQCESDWYTQSVKLHKCSVLTTVTGHACAGRNLLEDPWAEPSPDMFTRSVSPEQAPDKATYLNIDFERGDPVALDGEQLSPATLLARLNKVRAHDCLYLGISWLI